MRGMPIESLPIGSRDLFHISDRLFTVTQSQSLTVVHLDTKLHVTMQLASVINAKRRYHQNVEMLVKMMLGRSART
jgi:small basic protein